MSNEFDQNAGEDEEDLLAQALEELPFLCAEQRDAYRQLQETPFERQTPEQKEMIERLVLIGHGFSEENVDRFLTVKATPLTDRTSEERAFLGQFVLDEQDQRALTAQVNAVPEIRQAYADFANTLMVFPSRLHEPEYAEEVTRLSHVFHGFLQKHFPSGD